MIFSAAKRACVSPRSAAAFIRFYRDNLEIKRYRRVFDLEACERLIAATLQRQRGQIDAVFSHAGKLEAAAFSAWGDKTSDGLISTRHPGSGNLAAGLLVWEAIR